MHLAVPVGEAGVQAGMQRPPVPAGQRSGSGGDVGGGTYKSVFVAEGGHGYVAKVRFRAQDGSVRVESSGVFPTMNLAARAHDLLLVKVMPLTPKP